MSKVCSVLLIAFKFPPYSKVGSYRWTKYARFFAEQGIKVHVVTVAWTLRGEDDWSAQVAHDNIIIHRISSRSYQNIKYTRFNNTLSGNFCNRVRNQIDKVLRLIYFVDEAQHWGKVLVPYVTELLAREHIDCMIATGAPFMENYWAAVIHEKIGGKVPLIQDFRDEWNEGRGFPFKWQRRLSLRYEKYAVNHCDAIVTASPGLSRLFKPLVDDPAIIHKVVFNGFDPESVEKICIDEPPVHHRDFSFIYGGSLENGRDIPLRKFLDCVRAHLEKFPEIKIVIYTNSIMKNSESYRSLIDNGNLVFKKAIPQLELYRQIYHSFAALHFIPPGQEFIVSIKLFEYGIFKRPVVSVNAGGDTKELMEAHRLGFSVYYQDQAGLIDALSQLYVQWRTDSGYEMQPEAIGSFSFTKQTQNYIDLIEKITEKKNGSEIN